MGIGIDRAHWAAAEAAAWRAQRRRDELETERLLDEAGITDEEERARITGARCVNCGTMVLVEDYWPYAPNGELVCGSCLE